MKKFSFQKSRKINVGKFLKMSSLSPSSLFTKRIEVESKKSIILISGWNKNLIGY